MVCGVKKLVKLRLNEEFWRFLTFPVSRGLIRVRWDWMLLQQPKCNEDKQLEMKNF